MYEKEINLIDVSFIFLRKIASRECVLRGPKMLKIGYSVCVCVGGGNCSISLFIWSRSFKLLGRWPKGQEFQNDHYHDLTITM